MTTTPGPLRYITLADDDHQPLGIVAYGGADWTLNCGRCTHSRPSSRPDAAVTELLAHIEGAHRVPVVEVLDPAT